MTDFTKNQKEWQASWPESIEDRALVVDHVKMWEVC